MTSLFRSTPRSASHALRWAPEASCMRATKRRRHSVEANESASSSVSNDEIAHFTRLADHWWDEEGEFKLLHRMNAARAQFLRERVAWASDADPHLAEQTRFLQGKRVLDVGCGGGLFSEVLARLGAETLGLDAAIANVAVAEAHAAQDPAFSSQYNLSYRHATAEQLVAEGEQFDVVCSMEVVEHVEDPRGFLNSIAALTKPGGHVIMSSINRTPLARFLTITIAESPLLGFVSAGTHNYRKFIKPEELEKFFGGELGWARKDQPDLGPTASSTEVAAAIRAGGLIPPRERVETRGVIYSPLSGRWNLQARYGGPATKLCNYFFGARKPPL